MQNKKNGWPADLNDQIGKVLMLRLKLTPYNKKFNSSSINVDRFTSCSDLLDEFNSAASQVVPCLYTYYLFYNVTSLSDYVNIKHQCRWIMEWLPQTRMTN